MKDRIISIIKVIVMLVVVLALFITAKSFSNKTSVGSDASLIIYGDTIASGYSPFVKENRIYLSTDTISKFIDEDIYLDSLSNKVIITTEDAVYKFKVGENIATKNLKEFDAKSSCILVGNDDRLIDTNGKEIDFSTKKIYVDMGLVKDIYNIKVEYDDETNTISIDKLDTSDIPLNYNEVKLYSNINTKADILETLGVNNTVTVYTDSLKHNRWYKVKSDSGKIGYIEKSAVTINSEKKENENNEQPNDEKEKIIMFWQYGSNLDTLGEKIDGVNVVMPTWYALADGEGSVEINYKKDYYNKAKNNGYELWPIITNGIDNSDLDSKEITSEIMNSESKRENLIRNIIDIINANKLDGINIDFEGMLEEDKYMYTQFLRELYPLVKEAGAKLSVDIYFTNYIDRKGVGKACDYVILMGYDQRGGWSKEAGSISEIPWVEKNVKSLIEDSNISSSKIILGVPFYTRLWIEDGELSTKVYSMQNSQDFINKYNLKPTMDNISGQNYVAIELSDVMYKLWIEDAQSMEKRADLVNEYNLAGISAWQKGFETDDIWEVLFKKLK